jgi:amino acid transporter
MEEGRAEPVQSNQFDYEDPKTEQGEVVENFHTKRGLSSRQLQLIAIGGCIGTGLFVGSGQVLSLTGPGKTLDVCLVCHANAV